MQDHEFFEDVVRLLNRGIPETDVRKHLVEIGLPEAEAVDLVTAAGTRAVPPGNASHAGDPNQGSGGVAPEHRHFAENAASMLESGRSIEFVEDAMRQLGFDASQRQALLSLAIRLAVEQPPSPVGERVDPRGASTRSAPAEAPRTRWWQIWK